MRKCVSVQIFDCLHRCKLPIFLAQSSICIKPWQSATHTRTINSHMASANIIKVGWKLEVMAKDSRAVSDTNRFGARSNTNALCAVFSMLGCSYSAVVNLFFNLWMVFVWCFGEESGNVAVSLWKYMQESGFSKFQFFLYGFSKLVNFNLWKNEKIYWFY